MARIRVLGENPPPPRGHVEDQLRELRDYITRLKDELEFLLTHLGTDNMDRNLGAYLQQIRTDIDTSSGEIDTLEATLERKANQSQLAHYQETNVADHVYKVGEHFSYVGNLYRTTTTVAEGAVLTRGINCVMVAVGEGLVSTRTVTATTTAQGRMSTTLNIANAIVLSAIASGYFCSLYVNNRIQGLEIRNLSGSLVTNTSVTAELVVLYR